MPTLSSVVRTRAHLILVIIGLLFAACSGPDNSDSTPTATTDSAGDAATVTPAGAVATATEPLATITPRVDPTATPPTEATATPTQEPPPPTATMPALPTATAVATATNEPATIPTSTPVASDEFITIRTADTDDLIVALTFDAGADRGFGEEILDTLAAEGVTVTFGMTGVWAEANPDLIQRMVDEGHAIMNHTWDHQSWTGASTGAAPLTSAQRADQLERTARVVRDLTGYELAPYFRPAYGDYDDSAIADLQANGYTVNVMWTVDSLGWQGLAANDVVRRVVDGTVPGAIHLMHVGAASTDAAALPAIISELRDLGYEFVTVEDMVGR